MIQSVLKGMESGKARHPHPHPLRAAAVIAGTYLLAAALWILLSDRLVEQAAAAGMDPARLQGIKGLLFVGTTAALLFGMLYRYFRVLVSAQARLRRTNRALCALDAVNRAVYRDGPEERLMDAVKRALSAYQDVQISPLAEGAETRDGLLRGPDGTLSVTLVQFGKARWVLSLKPPEGDVVDDAEAAVLEKLGSDLSLGLDRIELRRQRTRAELETRKAWEELQRTSRLLNAIIEGTPDLVAAVDPQMRVLACNSAFTRAMGALAGKAVREGDELTEGVPNAGDFVRSLRQALAGRLSRLEKVLEVERVKTYRDTVVYPIYGNGATVQGAAMVAHDVTDRRVAEAALADRELYYRSLFHESAAVMLLVEAETLRVSDANEAAFRFYGYPRERLIGMAVDVLGTAPRDVVQRRYRIVLEKGNLAYESVHRTNDGTMRDVQIFAGSVRLHGMDLVHCIVHDTTEKRRLERQLVRAQRMQGVASVAAGMVHDLNNLFAPVLLNAQMLQRTVVAPGDLELLREIEAETRRGIQLVSGLLTYAHGSEPELRRLEGAAFLEDLRELLARHMPLHVNVKIEVQGELPAVHGDGPQLRQVLLNLCLNARDALPQGGELRCTGRAIELNAEAAQEAEVSPGRYLELEVSDTGPGIPRDILPSIFEPFFTTKAPGSGSGLGLSVSLGIVRSHGGSILVTSEEGKGARFRVLLPAAPEGR